MATIRKYPVGLQNFERVRKDGYVYVDKTPLIHKIISGGKFYFLSRPRRFGKSLLISTIEAVFSGNRELFEAFTTREGIEQPALYISQTDWEWNQYPVLRFDFSSETTTVVQLDNLIDSILSKYETKYGIVCPKPDFNLRLIDIVETAHSKTGHRVVVLVDEYDRAMLHSIGQNELAEVVLERFRNLFSPLKSLDEHLRFVFITGISKFSQMGIFSTLNNLENISMQQQYECICGITEDELISTMLPDIEQLAQQRDETFQATLENLKYRYDGYHFSGNMRDLYNPYSIVKAFKSGELSDYWFDSATPKALIDMLRNMPPLKLTDIEGVECMASDFDTPFDSYNYPIPVLYQSGYLTIKGFNPRHGIYTLGIPNDEVRRGFADALYKYVTTTGETAAPLKSNVLMKAYYNFYDTGDLTTFVDAIKIFYAGIPYHLTNDNERHYHVILYTLLTAFGADISAEEPSAKGRADMILRMPLGIYVIEIKYDGTADEALAQIHSKGYADKYRLDNRPLTCVGISFSSQERNITEWKAEGGK